MTTAPPSGTARTDDIRHDVVLLTRPNCHLCDDARAVLSQVSAELGIPWHEQSAPDDPVLLEKFAEEIPVLLIDGVQRDFWTIDAVRLRRLLLD